MNLAYCVSDGGPLTVHGSLAKRHLSRDLEVYLKDLELRGEHIDSPEKARELAKRIGRELEDQGGLFDRKYGMDNGRFWQSQLRWMANPKNFQRWQDHHDDVSVVRDFLVKNTLYLNPTQYTAGQYRHPDVFEVHKETRLPHEKGIAVYLGSEMGGNRKTVSYYSKDHDPALVYLEGVPDPQVEEYLYQIVEVLGSGAAVCEFLRQFKEAYPELFFGWWDRVTNFDGTKPMDGRKSHEMAHHMDVLTKIAQRPQMLWFIQRVDEIKDEHFEFATAKRYLDYYDRLQKGEDVFATLERLRAVNHFLAGFEMEDAIDQDVKQRLAGLSAENWVQIQKWAADAGGRRVDFFEFYGGDLSDYKLNINDTLHRLMDLMEEKGIGFFSEADRLMGLDEEFCIQRVFFYEIVARIEKQSRDLGEILPVLGRYLLTKDDDRPQLWFLNWGRARAIFSVKANGPSCMEFDQNIFVTVILFLHREGVLEQQLEEWTQGLSLLRQYKEYQGPQPYLAEMLFQVGVERDDERVLCTTELTLEKVESRSYWLLHISRSRFFNLFYEDVGQVLEQRYVVYGDRMCREVPPPPVAQTGILDTWLDTMTERYQLDPGFKTVLTEIFLTGNEVWPDEAALRLDLDFFEGVFFMAQLHQKRGHWISACVLLNMLHENPIRLHFAALPRVVPAFMEMIVRRLGEMFVADPGGIPASALDSAHRFLTDEKTYTHLTAIEARLVTMPPERRKFFTEKIFTSWAAKLNVRHDIGEDMEGYLQSMADLLATDQEQVVAFYEETRPILDQKHIKGYSAFQSFYHVYKTGGKVALKSQMTLWGKLGLRQELFDGNARFLKLTEEDVEHLTQAYALEGVDEEERFSIGGAVLRLTKAEYVKWYAFAVRMKERGYDLPVALSFHLFRVQNIDPAMELFNELGLIKKMIEFIVRAGPDEFVSKIKAWIPRVIPLLSDKIEGIRALATDLREEFGDYDFAEFNSKYESRNFIAMVETLLELLEYRTQNGHDAFFQNYAPDRSGDAVPEETIEVTAVGRERDSSYADHIDDPFQMNYYSLLHTNIPGHRFAEVTGGKSKDEYVESLLSQFETREIRRRQVDRLYEASEGVSRALLEELPFPILIQMQWLLNNLDRPDFREQVQGILTADRGDMATEYGGVLATEYGFHGIESLYDPLKIMPIASVLKGANGDYDAPDWVRKARFGYSFTYHCHSLELDNLNNAHLAGPSGALGDGGDVNASFEYGNSLVFTRLEDNKFNVDFFGVYPVVGEKGRVTWKSFVIDLGVFAD